MEKKILIVGGGLAGSVLAFTLLKKYACEIKIIDHHTGLNASEVAAGIYNPIVFKRLVKSWMADELIEYLDSFYSEMEPELEGKFHFKKEILKVFTDAEEIKLWEKKSAEPELKKFLDAQIISNFHEELFVQNNGFGKVLHAGNLNTREFLHKARAYFTRSGILMEEELDYTDLKFDSDAFVFYKNEKFDKVIFCEGHRALKNPWFDWLEFKLTKGEALTVKADLNIEKEVVNKGVFILPYSNNIYKVGATYEWHELNEIPTPKGKQELTEKLEKVIKVPYEIIAHEAGIRPTVKDRRPLLGVHPEYPQLAIFNGLGTKGVMLAPYFAKKLAEHLFENAPLEKEVDILRFWKK